MKKTITLSLLALAPSLGVRAQWTTDVSQNTTVRAVTTGELGSYLATDGPDGSTYVSWFENGSGNYQFRMQRLDAQGYGLWPDTGLVVSAFPQNSALFRYDLKSDADGNAVVAFQDERTGSLDIVAYKIGPDGSFLWGAGGVELPSPGTTGLAPAVAPLSNGNTAISWNMDTTPRTVGVQLVGPTGELLLASPIVVAAALNVSNLMPVGNSDGGFTLLYGVSSGGFGLPPWILHAQRYDAAGAALWADPVQVSTKTIPFFHFPDPVSDGHDGFYLAFNTSNPVNTSMSDVYVQRVRGNGTLWSVEGTRLDDSNTTHKFSGGKGIALINEGDGMMIPLQVTDVSQNQSGVSVQRVDTAGNRQLGDAAVQVIPVSAIYTSPADISATEDGAVIIHSSGTFGQQHIAATRVDLFGAPLWSPAQQDLSTANSNKDDVAVTGTRDGQAVVVWQDDRAPKGIYAQNITELATGIASIPVNGTGLRLEENPTDHPVLLLDPGTNTATDLDLFDAQGRTVYSSTVPSTDRIVLPLSGLKPGMYIIRLSGNGNRATVRWVK